MSGCCDSTIETEDLIYQNNISIPRSTGYVSNGEESRRMLRSSECALHDNIYLREQHQTVLPQA